MVSPAYLQSTLGVAGVATLGSDLKVQGVSTLVSPAFLQSTLDVTNATTLGSDLLVQGVSTLVNPAYLQSTLDVSLPTTLNSTLFVSGASTLTGDIIAGGSASFTSTGGSFLVNQSNVTFTSAAITFTSSSFPSSFNIGVTTTTIAQDLVVNGHITAHSLSVGSGGDLNLYGYSLLETNTITGVSTTGVGTVHIDLSGNTIDSYVDMSKIFSVSSTGVSILGNLNVSGETINTTVTSNTLQVGDKIIDLSYGATDLSQVSGGGLFIGTTATLAAGQTPPYLQYLYNGGADYWESNKDIHLYGNGTKIQAISSTVTGEKISIGSNDVTFSDKWQFSFSSTDNRLYLKYKSGSNWDVKFAFDGSS